MSEILKIIDLVSSGATAVILILLVMLYRSHEKMRDNHLKHMGEDLTMVKSDVGKLTEKVDDVSQRVAHVEGKLDIMGGV